MNQKLLNFTPKRYRCPYCGEWHNWDPENDYWDQETHLGYYKSANCKATLSCEIRSKYHDSGKLTYSFENGYCHYKTVSSCNISGEIPIKDIVENPSDGTATFSVPIDRVYRAECLDCRNPSNCLICALDEPSRSRQKKITLGFEFDTAVFELLSKVSRMESLLQELAELKSGLKKEEENMMNHVANNKEGNMATSIFSQLYHHSPEENVGIVKDWVEKYKPTLKWAVPVLTIYGAYRILNNKNSGLTVDNIDTVSSEKLGFSFDSVKDKKSLKHLMVLGLSLIHI